MPCYHPLKGYRSRTINRSGKRSITFNSSQGFLDQPLTVPCGQCIGCRLDRSRQWAIRCHHEASLHEKNCFITLTYAPEHVPSVSVIHTRQTYQYLVKKHFQDFMKRLRFQYGPGIRYFHCGEYGERYGRPHFHAILFNLDFHDKYVWRKNSTGEFDLYRSPTLEKLWNLGHAELGSVTFESAAYVARYIVKKVTGRNAEDHYSYVADPETGELGMRKPEYTTMSRRPGIGKPWLEKFALDVFPDDFVLVERQGKLVPCGVPKYYTSELEKSDSEMFQNVKIDREVSAHKHAANNTPARLRVREELQLEKLKLLKRKFDHEA